MSKITKIPLKKGVFFKIIFLFFLILSIPGFGEKVEFTQYLEQRFIPRYGSDLTKKIFKENTGPNSILYAQMLPLVNGRMLPSKEDEHLLFLSIEQNYALEAANYFRYQFLEYVRGLPEACIKAEFLEIDQAVSKIRDVRSKRKLYFELFRSLAFYYDIECFHHYDFLSKQLSLSRLALKVVAHCDVRSKDLLPTLPTDSSTFFVFENVCDKWLKPNMTWSDQINPPYPFAVFKTGRDWKEEKEVWEICQIFFHQKTPFISPSMQDLNGRQFVWETAYLFGFDDFFMPTQMIELYGQLGSLQPYWHYLDFHPPLPHSKHADAYASNVSKIAAKPFYACCLGSLLLSLYDQSFENCRYKQLDDGSLSILNFDSGCAFPSRNGFFPLYQRTGSNEVKRLVALNRTFWAWYFDFPQAKMIIKGSDLAFVQKTVAPWPEKFNDFLAYLHHPLNNYFLEEEERHLTAFKERLDIIQQVVMNPKEDVSMMRVLYKMLPSYKILMDNLTKFIPEAADSTMSVMGYANMSLMELEHWLIHDLQLPKEEVQEFLIWYHQFAAQLPIN